ncbi:MAG: DUF4830 domain-containing protein [Clostridia bacterium]|nr:DUF4830 domain-containing protein [Clostridia bacterium]MBR3553219.1 DUF4830 domain-containing protein [Clostridia bacterium]
MFIISVRSKTVRVAAAVLLCAAFVTIGGVYFVSHRASQPAMAAVGPDIPAETEDERLAFLTAQGLSVDKAKRTVRELVIPESFDETWTRYNALQQSQGFDLLPFRGKRVKVWSYPLLDEETRCANLMVCGGKLIAGDVADAAIDGKMEGIKRVGS